MNAPATSPRATACPLDCPDTCGLAVEVERGPDGRERVARVGALAEDDPRAHGLTQGFICGKVRHVERHVHGADRVLTPLVRAGPKGEGRFRQATWDGALALVAERLGAVVREHGGEAVLPLCYGGSNGLLSQDGLDATFFRRLGALRLARTLCAAPTGAALRALYGRMPGVALADFVHARLIVVFGTNPEASGIHHVPVLNHAQDAGARLVVVDPRRTNLAARADLHLAVRPGTDLPLALALHRALFEGGGADGAFLAAHATGADVLRAAAAPWTFERAAAECGVAAADVARLAAWLAELRPAVVRLGWGVERNRNGGWASAAILALPAVAGCFGVRGGGYTASMGGAWDGALSPASDAPEAATRVVNMNRVGRELAEPAGAPIRALFVYNANPLATLPDQERVRRGLLREDLFTVVHDAVLTDTARHADVVLPATTFLEHRDLRRGYGAPVLARVEPVLAPVGESRSNHALFGELLVRLGLARRAELPTEEQLEERVLGGDAARLAALRARGYLEPAAGAAPVGFVDVFPRTPGGKVRLAPEELVAESPAYAYRPDPASARFPLALISPALGGTISSTFAQLLPAQPLHLHPDDAAARGCADGDRVRAFNDLGEVRCRVAVDPRVRPGVAVLPKGLWARHTDNGATANALVPDDLSDLGGGACFNDARIEVERVPRA